ncbi:MAG: amidase [SAR324 cluster bacterium]|nr:amidase [SAR324 cluster bacterium]
MAGVELCYLRSTDLAAKLRRREVSAVEVTEAHLRQIERVNPKVNAIVTLVPEQALEAARRADELLGRGETPGRLHGLPVAHKDLVETRGIRTTYGSPIYKDHIPDLDALIVERMKAAGAITLGKTNTPEFGAGSQTFNEVFGATCNPYNTSLTCGGSSGGAAVSLACRMLSLADGSDLGGSLRNPANYCNVVGFRPSAGRVPAWPSDAPWNSLSVEGPLARTVEDAALLLSVLAGPDARAPLANSEPGGGFAQSLDRDFQDTRVAWSSDFGGLPVDLRTIETLESNRRHFESIGCQMEESLPDFSEADEIFKTWRAWLYEIMHQEHLEKHRELVKETIIWNTESGQKLSGPDIGRAEKLRAALYHRLREFMEVHEFLLLPVSQVPPFPVDQPYVKEINGIEMETYLDWMRSCYFISATGLPAISVPAGFTRDGMPVGLQIVGRPRDDRGVLQLAHAFEKQTGYWKEVPELAKPQSNRIDGP